MVSKTYVKTGTPSSAWTAAKKIYVKTGTPSSAWTLIKGVWVKDVSGNWQKVHNNAFELNSSTNPPANPYPYVLTTQNQLNLRTYLVNAGWNGTDDVEASFQLPAPQYLYSTSNGTAALLFPGPVPAASIVSIHVYGKIWGKSGSGGTGAGSNIFLVTPEVPFPASTAGEAGGPAVSAGANITLYLHAGGSITGGAGGGGGGGGAYGYGSVPVSGKGGTLGLMITAGGGGGGGGQGYSGSTLGAGAGGSGGPEYTKPPTPAPLEPISNIEYWPGQIFSPLASAGWWLSPLMTTGIGNSGSSGTSSASGGAGSGRDILLSGVNIPVNPSPAYPNRSMRATSGSGGAGGAIGNSGGNGSAGTAYPPYLPQYPTNKGNGTIGASNGGAAGSPGQPSPYVTITPV